MESPRNQNTGYMGLSREQLSELLHGYVDMVMESAGAEQGGRVMEEVSGAALEASFSGGLGAKGCDPAELFQSLRSQLVPASRKNGHPQFFGYICSSVDPVGAVFDGLASVFNQNVTAWRSAPGAVAMERQVLQWLDAWTGFDGAGQGLLVSGGSMANTTAIACALGRVAREQGQELADVLPRVTLYVSAEGHFSLKKAGHLLGVRAAHVRTVPIGADWRMDVEALEQRLEADRAAGLLPACVCASLGTFNTGAIDDLEAIAKVCKASNTWLHVDGAYGAPVARLPEFEWVRGGVARVDSLSIDPHKWLFAPIGVGCLLLRNEDQAKAHFQMNADYTKVRQTDPSETHAFFDLGFELSRPNRALKIWAILKTHGIDRLVQVLEGHIELRRYLQSLLEAQDRIEVLGAGLSAVCFRYLPAAGATESQIGAANNRLLESLSSEGEYILSPTVLDGHACLRACIVNTRTAREHLDGLVTAILAHATRL